MSDLKALVLLLIVIIVVGVGLSYANYTKKECRIELANKGYSASDILEVCGK